VVDLHGLASGAKLQFASSGFADLAEQEGFIVIYPEGVGRSWNAGILCCVPASAMMVQDVDFIVATVNNIKRLYNIDESRIYATGLSNGGAMVQRLGVEASDTFAAIVSYSQFLLVAPTPSSPMPLMEVHGYDDHIVPYDGGSLFPSALENFETWRDADGCTGQPEQTLLNGDQSRDQCTTYHSCAGGVEVTSCGVESSHLVYINHDGIDVSRMGWEFMKRFTR
jgi:polyhydroxybutyrate depolymerase